MSMIKKTQTIYLDEAGFTGNNLLDDAQPWFVFASIAIDENSASELRSEMRSRFKIHDNELKGANLVKRNRGRDAVTWLLENSHQDSLIMVTDKKYALAGKFFEYIFEPVIAEASSLFYRIDFHKFVATLLHTAYSARDPNVRTMLRNFENLMKELDPQLLESILSAIDKTDISGPLGKVLVFAHCHQKRIEREIQDLREMDSGPPWWLELSTTSVHWLLAEWGEQFESLEVYCDKSKPIQAGSNLFDSMVGRKDKAYIWFEKEAHPSVVYNLASPLNLVDSRRHPGVQIADILSSSVAYALNHRDDELSQQWLTIVEDVIGNAIRPDFSLLDPDTEGAFISKYCPNGFSATKSCRR